MSQEVMEMQREDRSLPGPAPSLSWPRPFGSGPLTLNARRVWPCFLL